ncbi:hypothetical protein VPZ60_004332 [Salmonella enterica]|nr:hypothetical protein [Salmonella enterica]
MPLLTHEAAEAIEWLRVRIPDRYFPSFQSELEDAMLDVLRKYGFDQQLVDGFNVKRLLARRFPMNPVSAPLAAMVSVRVTMYVGEARWAVDEFGTVFAQDEHGAWHVSTLSLDDVKASSTTYSETTIQIRSNLV